MLNKFGKLLKYEFRFYFRIMPPLYLILVLTALAAGFQTEKSGSYQALFAVIWGALIVAMTVINIVLIIQRFIDNFLKSPGYLMFTLPVSAWSLTASKAVAAFCTILMSALALFVSAVMYAAVSEGRINIMGLRLPAHPSEIIVFILVAFIMIFHQICLFYTVISASHLLPRFRFPAGIVMYFAIMTFAEQPVFRLLVKHTGSFSLSNSSLYYIPYGIAGLFFAALFIWTTGFLLRHRLNLE